MLQIYLKNKNFSGFFQVFWLKTEKDFQRTSLINCCCYSIKKNHNCIYLQIFFETVFFKMLETDIEVLGKGFFPLNILQPHIMNSRKLRFGFFVEWLAEPTAAQFGIFNRKQIFFKMSSFNMERFLWKILYLRKTNILCYEVCESNIAIETSVTHIFKKVRWLH